MQIFVQFLSSIKCIEVDSTTTVDSLKNTVCRIFNLASAILPFSNGLDICGLSNGQTLRIHGQLLGGGKNMSEGDKMLSLQSINCLICRKCYARNPLKAKICRKAGCGNASDLRPKKVFTKKK